MLLQSRPRAVSESRLPSDLIDRSCENACSMTASSLRSAVFEVERKFARLKVYLLHANGGSPPFKSLVHLGSRTFRDIYYDTDSLLSRAGRWVRQRDGD